MNLCGSCGVDLRDESRFCDECGKPVRACPECGHANDPAFHFCEECGLALAAAATGADPDQIESAVVSQADSTPPPAQPEIEVPSSPVAGLVECAVCGHVNPDAYRFCEECGRGLVAEPVVEPRAVPAPPVAAFSSASESIPEPEITATVSLQCAVCGEANPVGHRFCGECGASLVPSSKPTPRGEKVVASRRWVRPAVAVAAVAVAAGGIAGLVVLGGGDDGGGRVSESDPGGDFDVPGVVAPDRAIDEALLTLDLSDPDLSLNDGVEVELDDGSTYRFEDGTWTVYVDTDDGGTHQSRLGFPAGRFVDDGAGIVFQFADAPVATRDWAEWVLGDTPGVTASSGSWLLSDPDAFGEVLENQPSGGTWVIGGEETPVLFDDTTEMQFLYYVGGDGYTWFVDELGQAVWLLVEDASGSVVSAGVVRDVAGGQRYEPETGLDETAREHVDQALAVSGLSGLAAGSIVAVPAVFETGIRGTIAAYGWPCCEWVKKVKDIPGAEIVTSGVAGVVTNVKRGVGGAYDIGAGIVTLDGGRIVEGVKGVGYAYLDQRILWPIEQIGDLFPISTKFRCNRYGPGHLPSGAGRPVYLDQYEGQHAASMGGDQIALVNLARAWMPAVKLSEGEDCGHILRVMARVYPTTENGDPTPTLANAARVQITYTVFFDRDGGAAFTIGSHPGDNEGFGVGLVRSTRTDGRCGLSDPPFEVIGGKSAAHKDAAYGVVRLEEDQVSAGSWAGPCPQTPPTWGSGLTSVDSMAATARSGDDYFVWVSISKHGIYFSEGRCDVALRRFEECHEGRRPFDLSRWVEMIEFEDPAKNCEKDESDNEVPAAQFWPPEDQKFALNSGQSSFLCAARKAGGNYDVPGLASAPHAPVPEQQTAVPDVVGRSVSDAQQILEAAGFGVRFYVEKPDVADPADVGKIIEQEPFAGTFASQDSVVTLTIGGDLALVRVPDVIGDSASVAERAIEAAGLTPALSGQEIVDPNSGLVDRVAVQSPNGGDMVQPGTVVNFWVGYPAATTTTTTTTRPPPPTTTTRPPPPTTTTTTTRPPPPTTTTTTSIVTPATTTTTTSIVTPATTTTTTLPLTDAHWVSCSTDLEGSTVKINYDIWLDNLDSVYHVLDIYYSSGGLYASEFRTTSKVGGNLGVLGAWTWSNPPAGSWLIRQTISHDGYGFNDVCEISINT